MNKHVRNVPIRVSLTPTNIITFVESHKKNDTADSDKNHLLYVSNLRPTVRKSNLKRLSNHIQDVCFEEKNSIR